MEFIADHNRLLELHIKTKTVDPVFHEKSASFYELAFDLAHEYAEKLQDIGEESSIDCDVATKEALTILVRMQTQVDKLIGSKQKIGMDNMLRGFSDKLDFVIGMAKSLQSEEAEEVETTNPLYTKKI